MAAESSRNPTDIFDVSDHQATLNPPTSMASSYGIVFHAARTYIIVNAGFGDPVDALIEAKTMQRFEIKDYYEGIKTMLNGYKTIRLLFTADNMSVVSARYLYLDRSGKLVSLANIEVDAQSSMQMARFVLWCDYVRNDLTSAIKDAVKTTKSGKKQEDEEICVICQEEYRAEDMLGTLRCKHSYHDECIKKWLRKTRERDCPLCRIQALYFNF